jgi:hypothetical protein
MSSIPPPPIRAFYDIGGKIRKDRVYGYLNSLFGATEPNYTRSVSFKLPSLAVPAIFNEPTQKVSVDGNGIDPNIKPFTLYQFFNDKKTRPYEDYELTQPTKVAERQTYYQKVIIKSLNSAGRFVFIVPSRINSEIMTLFIRQSSTGFLDGRTLNWTDFDTKLSDRFQVVNWGGQKVYTQYLFRIGSKRYPTYKVLSLTNPKTRTLNYSETGFQT